MNRLFGLVAVLLLVGVVSASSNTINLNIYGAPIGSTFLYRLAPNFTTYSVTITNFTTTIPIYVSSANNATYHGAIPFQLQTAGTTLSSGNIVSTLLQTGGGTCNTQIFNTNGLNDFCAYYLYLNSSLWTSNQSAEIKASNASLNTAKIVVASLKNASNTAAYNGTASAGQVVKHAAISTSSVGTAITFLNTSVLKAPAPACITTNLNYIAYCSNATTPLQINVPIINGKFALTGKTYYPLNITFSEPLITGNKATSNYSVVDVTNSTVLTPLTTINNAASVSVTESFHINVNQQVEIKFNSGGDANYSKIIDDPITTPSGIVEYWSANAVSGNSMSANTQIQYTFNAGANQAYLATGMANCEAFNGISGSTVNSWIENTNSITSNTVDLWIENPDSGWLTDNNIYWGCASTGTTLQSKTGNAGIAPQLTNPYAAYDNGNIVFPFYDAFVGTSLSGLWGTFNSGCTTPSYAVSNGFTLSSASGGWCGIKTVTTYNSITYMSDSYAYQVSSTYGASLGWSLGGYLTGAGPSIAVSGSSGYPSSANSGYYVGYNNCQAISCTQIATGSYSAYQVLTQWNGGSATYGWLNYASMATSTGTAATSNTFGFDVDTNALHVQWTRMRTAPPSGVQPTTTFGAATSTYTAPTVSQPSASNAIIDVGQTETLTATITGGTPNYVGNFIASNVVSHTTTNTIAVPSQASTSLSESFVIVQANTYNSPLTANFVGKDANPTAFNSIPSANIMAYNTLVSTALTASNAILDPGQYDTFTANIAGGAPSYTYNFLVYNSLNTLVGNYLVVSSSTSVSYNFYDPLSQNFGADKANVIITDSATSNAQVTNSIGFTAENTLQISVVPSSATIDNGQSIAINALATGGYGTYSYNWYNNAGCSSGISGSTNSVLESPSSTTTYCVKVTDQASTPNTNTITSVITVNSAQVANVLKISNTIIDNGQYSTLTAGSTLGTGAKTFYFFTQANCAGTGFGTGATTNTVNPTSNTVYSFNSIDSAYSPNSICSASNTITVYPALIAGAITAPYTNIDPNQQVTLTSTPSGGSGSYSYIWYTGAACTSSFGGTASTQSVTPATTTTYYYKVTDTGITTSTSQCSAGFTITVATAPTITSTPGTKTYDIGQTITQTGIPANGISPYVYNSYIYNSGHSVVYSIGSNVVSEAASALGAGTYTYNVIAQDTSPAGATTFNTVTYTLTIDSALVVGTPTLSGTTLSVSPSGGTPGYTYQWYTSNAGSPACSSGSISGATSNSLNIASYASGNAFDVLVTDSVSDSVCSGTYFSLSANIGSNTVFIPIGGNYLISASCGTGCTDNIGINQIISGASSLVANGIGGTTYNFIGTEPGIYSFSANDITTGDPISGNIVVTAPLTFLNTTNSISYPTNTYTTANDFSTYYPFQLSASAGNSVLYNLNYTPELTSVSNPTILDDPNVQAMYSSNTALTGNVIAYDIIINSGKKLTTNGFSLIAYNALIYTNANIFEGNPANGGGGTGGSYSLSFAGSGGGGGYDTTGGCTISSPGGSTSASGGAAGTLANPVGGAGTTPTIIVNNGNILTWYDGGMLNYLSAGGGGGNNCVGAGGTGSYGSYLQANSIYGTGGVITAAGTAGIGGTYTGSGGGGGGIVIEAYNNFLSSGTNTVAGGVGGSSTYSGGNGGNGNVIPYHWTTQPISVISTVNSPTTVYTGVSNYAYILPSNSISGSYYFQTKEVQGSNSVIINASVAVNMTDINGGLTFNALCTPTVQYLQNCAVFPFGSNTFSNEPTSWEILSDLPLNTYLNGTGTKYNIVNFSNANLTFIPKIKLTYSFTSFIINFTNNPGMQNSITQNALLLFLSNSINTNYRQPSNFTVFSQKTFNGIANANLTLSLNSSLNGYSVVRTITNTTANTLGKYYLMMSENNYQNPTITYLLNASATSPLYYVQSDTFCPASVSPTQPPIAYPLGLVDTNGSKYNVYVYTSGGGSAAGYLLQILEQMGIGSIQVQSYKIPTALPFVLPLEAVGESYLFNVYSINCKTQYYKGTFSIPSNPIYITLNSTITPYVINKTDQSGYCRILSSNAIDYNFQCGAKDPTNLTFAYQLIVTAITSIVGTTNTVVAKNFSAHSFVYNFTEPYNLSYNYVIYGYSYNSLDPASIVSSGPLAITKTPISYPLLGFFAFLIMMVLIFGGATTGKVSILLVFTMVGVVAVSVVGLVNMLSNPIVIAVFIVLSALAIWWERRG